MNAEARNAGPVQNRDIRRLKAAASGRGAVAASASATLRVLIGVAHDDVVRETMPGMDTPPKASPRDPSASAVPVTSWRQERGVRIHGPCTIAWPIVGGQIEGRRPQAGLLGGHCAAK